MGSASSVHENEALRQQLERQKEQLAQQDAREKDLQQQQHASTRQKDDLIAAADARVSALEEQLRTLTASVEALEIQHKSAVEQHSKREQDLRAENKVLEAKLRESDADDKNSLLTRLRHYVQLTQDQTARIIELETTVKMLKHAAALAAAPPPEAPIRDYVLEYENSVAEFSMREHPD
eukprot:TRINITY_DN23772_c0_g1_i1.p1 TRINITY_DN23772_c0_g1~~TRINITY_DN23772_c0_g1_i1.p1  ORF type:complete len:179 (-),score=24.95 TRINITY_DN23772_c0_g1_i1:99-635(-)